MADRYTHGHHPSVLASHQWRSAENSARYLLDHLTEGASLLDVGCGPGNITVDFAQRVGGGSVIGLDRSAEVITAARSQYGATTGLSFVVGDVYHLEFSDEKFDVVHAHQVLQHLSRPVAAIEEMRRVLRPGGVLAVRDADYGAFAWAPSDPLLDRWRELYHALTRRNGAEADAGRHLKSWVLRGGFSDVTTTSSTWTYESLDERQWWGGLWAERAVSSDFAHQSLEYGLTNEGELNEIAAAFRRWALREDAIFVIPHVEVLARR